MKYISLHNHSEFSVQDSPGKYSQYIERAKELDMKFLGCSEHGNMNGVFQFHTQCRTANIVPIVGIEFYMNDKLDHEDKARSHLCAYARNFDGYKSLIKLQRLACENFYYRPLINHAMLIENAENLIISSACIQSSLFEFYRTENENGFEKLAKSLQEATHGNFWLELMIIGMKEQIPYNRFLIEMSKKLGIPYIIQNDVHFLKKDDEILRSILTAIRFKRPLKSFKESSGPDLWFKSAEQIMVTGKEEYGFDLIDVEYEKGFEETINIAERIDEFNIVYSEMQIPKYIENNDDAYEILQEVCMEKFVEKCSAIREADIYANRLAYELEVIKEKKFANVFLVVFDIVEFANKSGIYIGVGRGSAAGSLISYVLGITRLDPIQHGLIFERFLTLNREDPPDFDLDFDADRRDEIEQYIRDKYGDKNVANVITHGRFGTRGLIRDVGRVWDLDDEKIDVLAKFSIDDKSVVQEVQRYQLDKFADKNIKKFVEKNIEHFKEADWLRGNIRHASLHACGMVISNDAFSQVPLYRVHDKIVCGIQEGAEGRDISKFGMFKMDILGLSACSVISNSLKLIKERYGEDLFDRIHSFDFRSNESREIYNEFNRGNVEGIFQYSSSGMRKLISQVHVDSFDDLVAINALFRPSVLQAGGDDLFVQCKQNKELVKYSDDRMKLILDQTYGVIVYQEQILELLKTLGNFTLIEAENIRYLLKVIHSAKEKTPEKTMNELHEYFRKMGEECKRNGWTGGAIQDLIQTIEKYSAYSFNKSHAAAYAYTAFQEMWLKHKYPLEFFVSLMNSCSDEDRLQLYVVNALENNVGILPVHINKSKEKFTIEDSKIRAGFQVLDGIGGKVAQEIVAKQPYSCLEDFKGRIVKRVVNKRIISILESQNVFDFST